jgi:hypothetical protein
MFTGALALAGLTAMIAAAGASASTGANSLGVSASSPDPAITIGGGWYYTQTFGEHVNDEFGPFTYTSKGPTKVTVTDAFQCGDEYEVFDSGASLGTTSAVEIEPPGCPHTTGAEEADASELYSKGSFGLGAGSHSLSVQSIHAPFPGAAGLFLRVDPAACTKVVGRGTYLRKFEEKRVTVLANLNTEGVGKQSVQVSYETGTEHFHLLKLENAKCDATATGHVFSGEGPAKVFGQPGFTMTFKLTEEGSTDTFSATLKGAGETIIESGTFTRGGKTFS